MKKYHFIFKIMLTICLFSILQVDLLTVNLLLKFEYCTLTGRVDFHWNNLLKNFIARIFKY